MHAVSVPMEIFLKDEKAEKGFLRLKFGVKTQILQLF
jgi:hypothetical protein